MLKLVDIWFRYPDSNRYLFQRLNIEFREKELTLITGPNGSGKSTLLMIAAGLLEPERGEVLFREKPLKKQLPEARRFIGISFQDPEYMLFNSTVYDEIAYVPRQLYEEKEVDRLVRDTIKILGLSEDMLKRSVYQLSYGEKKIVALGSILSYKPLIILLDEPLESLSKYYRDKILYIIERLLEENKTIIIATHDPDLFIHRFNPKIFRLEIADT
ncbi:MAG: energy-coupling factor ABC transporter ATP-binding protein [Desulfurococcales archaeon]|nr:energy-coupling factor ABC transporter ATP-binding protein [Desulfurococcales archaeon]